MKMGEKEMLEAMNVEIEHSKASSSREETTITSIDKTKGEEESGGPVILSTANPPDIVQLPPIPRSHF